MKKLLVTGGDGFIGSHLVEALLNKGAHVRILDNLSARNGANIDRFKSDHGSRLEVLVDDIRSMEACRAACRGVDHVLHEAGLGSVPGSVADPVRSHAINATGTLNMLWAAKEAGVKRFVWASSSSVYGDLDEAITPKSETMKPLPLSPYGASKLIGEHYARLFHLHYGLETVSLRYFNVFGPRQDPDSPYAAVVPRFIQALSKDEPPTIYGDGSQSRDFTYVGNVVEANLYSLEAPAAAGQILNVATGETHSILELARLLARLMDREIEPVFADARPGDVKYSLADISLCRRVLGLSPTVGFEDGLRLTVEAAGFGREAAA